LPCSYEVISPQAAAKIYLELLTWCRRSLLSLLLGLLLTSAFLGHNLRINLDALYLKVVERIHARFACQQVPKFKVLRNLDYSPGSVLVQIPSFKQGNDQLMGSS
jgi:hypothetical protein